jgi:hypothetical protein
MDQETGRLLTDFVMMVGLLRRDMKHNKEMERYEGRFSRIDKKFSELAEFVSRNDPEFAKALRTAFEQPSRTLAFKNADHQKKLKAENDTPRHRDTEDEE